MMTAYSASILITEEEQHDAETNERSKCHGYMSDTRSALRKDFREGGSCF